MSDGVAAGSKNHEQISFRFCSECSNMLYPKEDEDSHKLQFTCRTCQYTEDAQSTCVFRNVLNTSAGETAGVTQDVGTDPTVSESPCPNLCAFCGIVIYCGSCGEPVTGPHGIVERHKSTTARDSNEAKRTSDAECIADYLPGLGTWDLDDYDEELDNTDGYEWNADRSHETLAGERISRPVPQSVTTY